MTTSPDPIHVVAIGGIDPTGGSGISRDAATLAGVGVTPIVIASALTVQDDHGVTTIAPVAADLVADQLEVALRAGARTVKTGMLHRAEIADAILAVLRGARIPVVVDPVLEASSGGSLSEPGLPDALNRLREVATLVTPNLAEAERLLRASVQDRADAAAQLTAVGWHAAIVTGGDDDATDHLSAHGEAIELVGRRRAGAVRGTGCAFASLIAASLARGVELEDACRQAKGRIARAVAGARDGLLAVSGDPVWTLAGHPFE